MKQKLLLLTINAFLFVCVGASPALADRKIKQRVKMQGQTMETTVMIKGARQRTETSISGEAAKFMPKVATVMQCDQRRNLQINDQKRLYLIEPFAEEETTAAGNTAGTNVNRSANAKSQTTRGGVITMTTSITDTGERQQMFGLTARRIKTVMAMEPSADACQKEPMRMETDGWYVDLPGFSCPVTSSTQMPQMPQAARAGCQDRMRYKTTGAAINPGFPLNVTTTIFDKNGRAQMSMTTETLELSNAALDASLFDIPVGYSLAASSEDLYKFDTADLMRQATGNQDADDSNGNNQTTNRSSSNINPVSSREKKAGIIRIGVLNLSNKSDQSVSTEALRSVLIENLSSGNVEAIAVDSLEEAKAQSCDFVLHTDITKLKQSTANKLGGVFGKVTGVEATKDKFDVQIDYKLVSVTSGQTAAQNKVANKFEGSAEKAAETALSQAARAVMATAAKN